MLSQTNDFTLGESSLSLLALAQSHLDKVYSTFRSLALRGSIEIVAVSLWNPGGNGVLCAPIEGHDGQVEVALRPCLVHLGVAQRLSLPAASTADWRRLLCTHSTSLAP